MSELFADAFYYIALLNPNDQYHATALEATNAIRRPIVTTLWVLLEVADALSAPSTRRRVHRFLEDVIVEPNTLVISDVEPWLSRGLALYGSRADKSWSLTDCITFEVMSARGIADALTGDRHFTQAAFQALLPVPFA